MVTISDTHLDRPLVEPVMPLLTAADLAVYPDDLPSGPVKYELDNGRLIVDAMPGGLTAADLDALPTELPRGTVDYELDNGRLIIMSPTGDRHADVHLAIGSELKLQGERRGHGKAYVEVGVILWKDPFRVVGPDVAFVKRDSLPVKTSPEGYLETVPELIVEVRSKNDTKPYVARKVADYLATGVQLVWIVDPEVSTVEEHRPGLAQKTHSRDSILQCEDVIPGFRLSLADLFPQS